MLKTQYFSCCLLHFINSYFGIYFKTTTKNKTKQNSKTNKQAKKKQKRNKKRKKGKSRSLAGLEPGAFELTQPHMATTPLRVTTCIREKS